MPAGPASGREEHGVSLGLHDRPTEVDRHGQVARLPCDSNHASRSWSSCSIRLMALCIRSSPAT